MPICPKCKYEYREGMTYCPDCKCDLVDELEELPDTEELEEAYITPTDISEADIQICMNDVEVSDDEEELISRERHQDGYKSGIYRNSAERAEDNKSSAWTLLSVGVLGIVVLILIMMGVLPIQLYGVTKYLIYGVMFALFILFIVMGIISLRNSKIFAQKAESEVTLSDSMKEWCRANINAEQLDAILFGESDTADAEDEEPGEEITSEAKYFKRIIAIKHMLADKFMNLDEGFLEDFVDNIYEEIFED